MPLARDVMQTHLVTVEPELPLVDVHRLFVEEEITGAPVVDETGRLLGVISSTDLLRAVDEEHGSASSETHYFRESLEFSGPDWARAPSDFQDRLAALTVEDAMTRGGITVAPETSAAKPWTGSRAVMRIPSVRMMRQPPYAVPTAATDAQLRTIQSGT